MELFHSYTTISITVWRSVLPTNTNLIKDLGLDMSEVCEVGKIIKIKLQKKKDQLLKKYHISPCWLGIPSRYMLNTSTRSEYYYFNLGLVLVFFFFQFLNRNKVSYCDLLTDDIVIRQMNTNDAVGTIIISLDGRRAGEEKEERTGSGRARIDIGVQE